MPAAKKIIVKKPVAKKAAAKKVVKPDAATNDKLDKALAARPPIVVKAMKSGPARKSEPKAGGPTKRELAQAIFDRMKGKSRKEVIAVFQAEAGLTPAGSSTYFQLCRTAVQAK